MELPDHPAAFSAVSIGVPLATAAEVLAELTVYCVHQIERCIHYTRILFYVFGLGQLCAKHPESVEQLYS